ncbi:hypothetical protein [Rhodoferax saidenbachensis]|uniref:DUF3301 domain-containing protein n=1 Tax=Rhodoferax saidenbachensis TaxID=1484693 RepID=A0ABU1ZLB2_9BURK|nr:hypothetical protein [Rhodoferax saidenbachensis]MDR7306324.1 hypothetical protein [Rhodoferax saidenbachensis]
MNSLLSLDGIATIVVVGLVFFLANWFWKRQALARAREWAASTNMTVRVGSHTKFQMDRQTPQITFEAVAESGRRFRCTLRLQATSFIWGPLHSSATAELLEKTEVLADAA